MRGLWLRRWLQSKLRRGQRGMSTLTVMYFCAFVLVPLFVVSLGIGRYMHAYSVLYTAADAAALAAAQDIDAEYYKLTGEIRFMPWAADEAGYYVMYNSDWLVARQIYPEMTHVHLHHGRHVVEVTVGANVQDLFAGFIGPVWMEATAEAEVGVLQDVLPP